MHYYLDVCYSLADGPCFDKPCKNGGTCMNDTISLFSCKCPDGFVGETCEREAAKDTDNFALIIAICCVGAFIVLCTILALVICSQWEDRSTPTKQMDDEGPDNLIATSWSVSYGTNANPGKDLNVYSNGGFR